jgi:hypothetical protein
MRAIPLRKLRVNPRFPLSIHVFDLRIFSLSFDRRGRVWLHRTTSDNWDWAGGYCPNSVSYYRVPLYIHVSIHAFSLFLSLSFFRQAWTCRDTSTGPSPTIGSGRAANSPIVYSIIGFPFYPHLLFASFLLSIPGVDVSGYIHWTITDNWEWADGYCPDIVFDYRSPLCMHVFYLRIPPLSFFRQVWTCRATSTGPSRTIGSGRTATVRSSDSTPSTANPTLSRGPHAPRQSYTRRCNTA